MTIETIANPIRLLLRHRRGSVGLLVFGVLMMMAWLGPMVTSSPHITQNLDRVLEGPSSQFWLGTDQLGRDFFLRLAYGLRTTLGIVMTAIGLASVAGTTAGVAAGYLRGPWESVLLRSMDMVLSLPGLILALVIATIMGRGNNAVLVALFVRAVPTFARVAHSATLKVMAEDYVKASVASGATWRRIIGVHVLRNITTPLIMLWPIQLGVGILIAASLSFFGLGVQSPTSELGLLIAEGRRYARMAPKLLWVPGLLLASTNVSLSLLSEGLGVFVDPLKRRALLSRHR